MRENDLLDRTFSFAVRTLKFHKLARICNPCPDNLDPCYFGSSYINL